MSSVAKTVTAKKTTTAKKGVVKKPVKKESASKVEKPKMHAKNVSLIISIGNDDRERSIEKMTEQLKSAITKAGYKNVTVMSSYYILDGKVCNPADYDEKTQNFKPGATPPPWAGGPSVNVILERVGQDEFKVERPAYSPKENMDAIRPILEANAAKKRKGKAVDDDDGLEEFDWDVEDASDDEKLEEVASKSRKVAIKKLTSKKTVPAKKVVKKKKPGVVIVGGHDTKKVTAKSIKKEIKKARKSGKTIVRKPR